uniref:Uncharacterized protein n=1 Tax=Lotharella globosa TaxID=91324 RepID=A0A7S4DNS8_9EUKA
MQMHNYNLNNNERPSLTPDISFQHTLPKDSMSKLFHRMEAKGLLLRASAMIKQDIPLQNVSSDVQMAMKLDPDILSRWDTMATRLLGVMLDGGKAADSLGVSDLSFQPSHEAASRLELGREPQNVDQYHPEGEMEDLRSGTPRWEAPEIPAGLDDLL